jgi:hypothetical protein
MGEDAIFKADSQAKRIAVIKKQPKHLAILKQNVHKCRLRQNSHIHITPQEFAFYEMVFSQVRLRKITGCKIAILIVALLQWILTEVDFVEGLFF